MLMPHNDVSLSSVYPLYGPHRGPVNGPDNHQYILPCLQLNMSQSCANATIQVSLQTLIDNHAHASLATEIDMDKSTINF